MAYEDRSATTGSHVMTCDTPQCHHEMLSPGRDELIEDLSLAGWAAVGKNKAGDELFVCPHCSRGQHPGAAVMKSMFGGTDEIQVEAPCPVHKGEPFHDSEGNLVGHYMSDAQQGDPVMVKLQFPEPQSPPGAVELYDDMMEGTDDDDDKLGRVSAVAPAGVDDGARADRQMDEAADMAERHMEEDIAARDGDAPVPRSLDAAAGESGSGGVVESADRPDTTTPDAKERLQRAPTAPRGPQLNTTALDETAALFANLDTTSSDWDPDAD